MFYALMKNMYNIKFTEYSRDKSVLHIDDCRHFLIKNAQKDIINGILTGDDENEKKSLYAGLCSIKNEQTSFLGVQDYQMKKTIISSGMMNIIAAPFIFLFHKYIFPMAFAFLAVVGFYMFFISEPQFIEQEFSMKASWLLIPIMALFHEIGHAGACKKYGAAANEVGIGIAGFRPVMYANVSSAWYLPRFARIIVNLGGVYFQMLFSVMICLLSMNVQDTSMFYACKVMFISVIFQFYPFFRSDGYWMISDILDEPNLYKKAKSVFIKKISNYREKLNNKEIKLFVYYISFELLIIISIVTMTVRYYKYIITLPLFIMKEFMLVIHGDFKSAFLIDIKYIWAFLFLSVACKYIVQNIKYICPKGAGQV